MTAPARRPVPGASIGLDDRSVLALTLHHEASGEGRRGMLAVGCVIRNRAAWGKWGPSLRDVCLAWKQYSCWRPAGGTMNYGRLVVHADALRRGLRPPVLLLAFDVADAVMHGVEQDLTGGADHYWAPRAMVPPGRVPSWAVGVTPTATIGGHVFCRLRPGGAEVIRA
jgi:N-acetylmuramoyl-L-alanine amidase